VILALAATCAGCASSTTRTVTETATVVIRTSAAAAAAAPAGPAQSYAGNGTKTIGTITIRKASTIEWACSGCATFAFTSHVSGTQAIVVSSTASSGTSAVDPGSYPDAQVISNGNWTIRIVSAR
jgi:hypothetical protein